MINIFVGFLDYGSILVMGGLDIVGGHLRNYVMNQSDKVKLLLLGDEFGIDEVVRGNFHLDTVIVDIDLAKIFIGVIFLQFVEN